MYLGTDVMVDQNYELPMNYIADLQVYMYCEWPVHGYLRYKLVDMMVILRISAESGE
jgi:hypothetical protein